MISIVDVYDLECLSNIFTYTGYDYKNNKWSQFVICGWRNNYIELIKYLSNLKLQVGFNNLSYDYPLLHHLIKHYNEYKSLDGEQLAKNLYKKSQSIIEDEFSMIRDKYYIDQIDLFRIWHYGNAARMTSLKDLEIAMKLSDVEEMPIHHTTWCKSEDEKSILSYNKNDVYATYQFFLITLGKTDNPLYKGKNKIQLRKNLTDKFNVNCLNLPDVGIGEQLMLNLYARETNQSVYDLKKKKTYRNFINLKECIPFWCKIETIEFNSFLHIINNTIIKGEKKEFEYSVIFHNFKFDFGSGGSHGCIKPGVYKATDTELILDLDVSSLYPSVARSLNLYPSHLGPEFMRLYEQFIDARIKEKHKPKEERDNVLIEGYKLLLNGTYGKSGEETSFMFDNLYKYRTTIGGQLFICMWAERLVKYCPELKFIQANTDGLTIIVPKNKLELIRKANQELTDETSLVVEEAFYSKMIIKDVNNYQGVYDDNSREKEHIKLKGCFEIDKEFHKDPSMRIVPIALKEYFVNNVPIEETIRNHKDIYDFCLRLKTNSKSTPYFKHLENGEILNTKLNRTTRYYISNTGGILLKDFGDNKLNGVNVGYSCTLFNHYIEKPISEYNINYSFYINEANKIKYSIDDGQLSLFDF